MKSLQIKFLTLIIVINSIVLILANFKLHSYIPIFFTIIAIVLFINDKKLLIILYLVLLPTNGLILRKDLYLGIIGVDHVLNILCILVLFFIVTRLKIRNDEIQKLSKHLIYFVILYVSYLSMKNYIYGLENNTLSLSFLKIISVITKLYPLLLLIDLVRFQKIKTLIRYGVIFGFFNMIFFTIISPIITKIGLNSSVMDVADIESGLSRFRGVFGGGDQNSLGVFFVMFIGFSLQLKAGTISRKMMFLIIGTGLIGVALTGSRTAFTALAFIYILQLFRAKVSMKNKMFLLVSSIAIIIVFSPFFNTIYSRLGSSDKQLDLRSKENRIGKWGTYIDFLLKTPKYLIGGTQEKIIVFQYSGKRFYRAAHNFMIQILYETGVFFLLFFLIKIIKIIVIILKKKTNQKIELFFVPFFSAIIFTSDFGVLYYFILYFSMSEFNSLFNYGKRYSLKNK